MTGSVAAPVKRKVSKLPDERDDRLIERAFAELRVWATTFAGNRERPAFGSIFEPVFVAIVEARGASRGRLRLF